MVDKKLNQDQSQRSLLSYAYINHRKAYQAVQEHFLWPRPLGSVETNTIKEKPELEKYKLILYSAGITHVIIYW